MHDSRRLTADVLLRAYTRGVFPMAAGRNEREIRFYSPNERGVLPLDRFRISRRLARTVRSDRFQIRINSAFTAVVQACAAPGPQRTETWINDEIINIYTTLHWNGYAHSVECWREGRLEGGLYGVAIGAAFFGESMFSRERDASKVALVHLVARLRRGGFVLLDTQFITPHLAHFGAAAIPRARYMDLLAQAVARPADFDPAIYCPEPSGNCGRGSLDAASGEVGFTADVEATTGANWPGWFVLQLITQTS
ncbi:MAG: leucyl/phenylalanyl-tRNA--protein transferase [Rhizomicrobium sp.]